MLIFGDKGLLLLPLLVLGMVGQKGFDGLLRLVLVETGGEFGDDLGGRGSRSGLFHLSRHRDIGHRAIISRVEEEKLESESIQGYPSTYTPLSD